MEQPAGSLTGWERESADTAPALTVHERIEAEQVARRLQEELRALLSLLPERDRGASALARALRVDRATCQRIVAGAARANAGAESLVQFPGVQGLRQFLAAMSMGAPAAWSEQLAATAAAIDRLDALIDRLGGSQRRLRARLGLDGPRPAMLPGDQGADNTVTREALFRAAAAATGRWSAATLDIRIVRPVPGQPDLTEGVRVRGIIGHVSRPDAVPLEVGENAPLRTPESGPAFSTLGAAPASGRTPGSLLPEFCSRPLPGVTSRSVADKVIWVIDTAASAERPLDFVLAHRGAQPDRHPATLNPPLGEMWSLVTFPTRRMVLDVFLHREIAERCTAAAELHLWGPDVTRHGSSRWSTRFPGGPTLERLGPGLSDAGTPSYARHAELLGHIFAEIGWPAEEFVGYRCEVLYPLWRAGYLMAFDFAKDGQETK